MTAAPIAQNTLALNPANGVEPLEASPLRLFQPGDFLDTLGRQAAYLNLALEEDDGSGHEFARALGVIARRYGMTEMSQQTGANRQALYAGLSEKGNPGVSTVLRALSVLGLRLTVTALEADEQ